MLKLNQLQKLGFTEAHRKTTDKIERCRKMDIAYKNHEFICQEDIDKFNDHLKEKTFHHNSSVLTDIFDKLTFIPVENYPEVPPVEVLDKMEAAVQLQCFDTFEVAKIESIKEVKDPILFGRVNKCGDRFFIAQWDDDISIEEIRKVVNAKK